MFWPSGKSRKPYSKHTSFNLTQPLKDILQEEFSIKYHLMILLEWLPQIISGVLNMSVPKIYTEKLTLIKDEDELERR